MLDKIQEMVKKLQNTSKTSEKEIILRGYDNLKDILKIICDEKLIFNVTSESLKNNISIVADHSPSNIFELLNILKDNIYSGHELISIINNFISNNLQYKELIYNIIDKDLKCGISVKTLNSIWSNLITEFECALGYPYENEKDIDWNETYLVSRKLDGNRLITTYKFGKIEFFSRKGNKVETVNNLIEEVKEIAKLNKLDDFVLDGELCWVENDKEDFPAIMKVIRRKDYSIPLLNLKYYIFDFLTTEDFYNKKSKVKLIDRLERLEYSTSHIIKLEQRILTPEVFLDMSNKVKEFEWEGLILRKDTIYKGKRSKDILKVKKFFDSEFKVISMESELIRIIVNGKEERVEMLSNVYIDVKGNKEVGLGSGFSQEERIRFFKNPSLIIGHKIKVKYFEETIDTKTGKPSLRFPIYLGIRDIVE